MLILARNAQLLGRYRSFPARIVVHLDDVNSSMGELSSLKVARFAEILYFVSKNSAFLLSIVGIVQYKFYDCLTLEGLFNNVEIEALR